MQFYGCAAGTRKTKIALDHALDTSSYCHLFLGQLAYSITWNGALH
jgi:hypothetical protein